MTQRTGNIIFSVLLILIFTYLIHIAISFEGAGAVGGSELGSGVFPIVISSFVVVCCLINIFKNIKKEVTPSQKAVKIELDRGQFIRVTITFASCVVSYFVWARFGFIAMSMFFMVTLYLALGVRSVRMFIFLLLFGPAVYFVFDKALQISLQ